MALESLSRGARSALCLDNQTEAVKSLLAVRQLLGANGLQVEQADTLQWLATHEQNRQPERGDATAAETFDIIFLDPPFAANLLQSSVDLLAKSNLLSDRAWVYLEFDRQSAMPQLPIGWELSKEKKTGGICCCLIRINLQ